MAKTKKVSDKKGVPLWVWAALAVIAVAVVALVVAHGNRAAQTLPDEVSVQQAAELCASGAFVLDVREPNEWAEAHIPGATLIPLGELESRMEEVPQDQTVLVYCRSGSRSTSARGILRAAGYPNVTSLSGGITAWIAAGYETVSGQ